MATFKNENRNWVEYRQLPNINMLDFHNYTPGVGHDYWESMQSVYERTLSALMRAQQEGKSYVLITHGHSTSRLGRTTSRSQVRKAMRSKEATPLIIRRECIQDDSVFLAAVKPLNKSDV